jgi:hypothetical protein
VAELLVPYSDLVAQVAAVAIACAIAALVLRGRIDRVGYARAAALTIAALMAAVGLGNLWSAVEGAADTRTAFKPPPGVSYSQKCLADQSQAHLTGYFDWLRGVLPPDAIYAGTGDTCYAFQLLPAVPARPGQLANWTVYPDKLPPDALRQARRERDIPTAERTVFVYAGTERGAVRGPMRQGPPE